MKKAKLLTMATLLTATLMSNTLISRAQTVEGEDIRSPHRIFLPLVTGDTSAGTSMEESPEVGEQAEADMQVSAEEQAAMDSVLLNTPAPEIVRAATVDTIFTVTKVFDSNDGLCDSDCSLREALMAAAADPTTHDRVVLPAGIYRLFLGELLLVNVEVLGADARTTIIDGDNTPEDGLGNAVWEILTTPYSLAATADNRLEKITVRNARLNAIQQWNGSLTLTNVVVQQGGNNGAVESHAGPLSIYNSILERSAIGLRNYASPIYLENSQIRKNSDFGILDGATDVTAELKIVNSTVANNGGIGIYKRNGDLQMDNSSVVGNHDNGLEIRYSKANIRNSTISGNRSKHAKYGEAGVFVKGSQVELYFVSVVRNVGGGLEIDAESLVNLYGTIVADNRADKYPDCDGKINSQGFNLVENLSGCTITGVTTGNILGLDPRLGALYRNGGSTPNHLPVRNSPVVDAITTEACQGRISDERFTDQRYQARPRDGDGNGVMGCDIGAVERQSATERSRR